MSQPEMTFWSQIDELQEIVATSDRNRARKLIGEIGSSWRTGNEGVDAARQDLLELMSSTFDLDYAKPTPRLLHPIDVRIGQLPKIIPEGNAGVSLVTCCMNREDNLIRALNSWVTCQDISEIIIVDWSSEGLVRDSLRDAEITDPRIRVVRVEDEPRWILTYAFNVGFRVASCDRILKVDADIVLDPEFFSRNRLKPGHFIAGNWRSAANDQAHVNGFFYLFKADLAAVAGFNEHITTYGWDDDDIYDRLGLHGVIRSDVDIGTIHHLPHSDEERVGPQDEKAETNTSGFAELHRDTALKIRSNRLLAYIMPEWNEDRNLLPFQVLNAGCGDLTLRREGGVPHPVAAHIAEDVDYYATLEMTAWRLGRRVLGLDRVRLGLLLETPFSDLGAIDVEVALSNAPEAVLSVGGYLVVHVDPETIPGNNPAGRAFDVLCSLARRCGLTPVLSGPFQHLPEMALEAARACAFVPDYENLGTLNPITAEQLKDMEKGGPRQNFRISYDTGTIAALNQVDLAAPALATARTRIFVDGQHGLGNRLRAIGSAGAIAEKADLEMVVVWQPDDHCDCRFSDLFDYDGAVIEESFIDRAVGLGCTAYNYMEVEPGAEKDAEIRLGGGDIYARSAYVLNNSLSTWEDENRFLRTLRPMEAVRDMVAGVRCPNDISAHVRMAGGKAYEHLPYESPENWGEEGHEQIAHWREKSHFSHFIKRIDALIAEGKADRIFLAADKPETYAEFQACFGDRLAMLERDVYDRSAEQLRYALADVLLLGSSPLLLGSTWSSFSELAMRLSPQKMKMEMSGTDF